MYFSSLQWLLRNQKNSCLYLLNLTFRVTGTNYESPPSTLLLPPLSKQNDSQTSWQGVTNQFREMRVNVYNINICSPVIGSAQDWQRS